MLDDHPRHLAILIKGITMKILKGLLIALFIFATAPNVSAAQEFNGDYMVKYCELAIVFMEEPALVAKKDDYTEYVFGTGYCFGTLRAVLGVNTLYEAITEGHALFCMLDETITYVDVVKYIIGWARENPTQMTWSASQVMIAALKTKYPCYKDITKAFDERCVPQFSL